MSVLPLPLLPDNASLGAGGRLFIGGCDTLELAQEFGTPLFVYDEAHLRERCRQARTAFAGSVAYAAKAFLCLAMVRLAHEEGLHLDVATGGELYVARAAGMPGHRLVMNGNNKSAAELSDAVDAGVGRIVVDSFDELDRLDALHQATGARPRVLLRITPGVEVHTHEYVTTGVDDTKFGFTASSGMADAAINRCRRSGSVELMGLHAHIGSQVFELGPFRQAVEVIAGFAQPYGLPELSLGGGLGVAYVEGESAPSIAEWAAAIDEACAVAGFTAPVSVEPGRALVASSAITLYRVGTIKDLPGIRTYVSVDGGMSDNPRPVLYGSGYETFLPRAVDRDRDRAVRVVGKHCESGDLLVRDGWVPGDIKVDDILATPVTGAYGHSMGSNYNKVPRPAVVFVRDGEARLVIRRETHEDLIRNDL
ncbi:diaminopimelate decarboxylase [Candidatus Poriferisocius sp.]|uniref:diaminopimelate decarboxylase n=1 Tax=Candidatus Poriferisocius sp. TaxID=3101276 RepID=UPI003B0299A3